MRGQRFFNEQIKNSGLGTTVRKGRSDKLVNRRNECLIARYYYYGYYKNKCYEEILKLLESEFFLSQATISHMLQVQSDQVLMLKDKKPALFFFQNRWAHLKW